MKFPNPKLLLLVGTAAVDPGAPFCTVEVVLEPPPPVFDAPPVGFVVGVGVDDVVVVVVGVELVALFVAVLPDPELLLVV